jgi:hypothetical protein
MSSKSKTIPNNSNPAAPISTIPPEEMRAAILENRLPTGLLLPPHVLPQPCSMSQPSEQTAITIKAAARRRLEAAKRWVSTSAANVESIRHQLDAALKVRHEALNEQIEAARFLDRVNASLASEKRQNRMMQMRNRRNKAENPSKVPAGKETETISFLPSPESNVATEESNQTKSGEGSDRAEETEQPKEKQSGEMTKQNDHVNTLPTENTGISETVETGRDDDGSTEDTSTTHDNESNPNSADSSKPTNKIPLKKRPSNSQVNDTDAYQDPKTSDILNEEKCNHEKSEDGIADQIIHLKTVPPPTTTANRRFIDLTPEAQDILRKTVLASLSNNGQLDAIALKRATDIGIPEHSVKDAVRVAWDKLRSKVSDAAAQSIAASSKKVLHLAGVVLSGFDLSEYNGVYLRCHEEDSTAASNSGPAKPPCFEKKDAINDTSTFRLYYVGKNYPPQGIDNNWEVAGEKSQMRYSGSLARSEKVDGSDSAKSFRNLWVSSAGRECLVTITPLYSDRV